MFGQSITVVDQQSLQPIPGVVIAGIGTEGRSITNDQGAIDLAPLLGAAQVQITHVAYTTQVLALQDLLQHKGPLHLQRRSYDLEEVVISANRFQELKRDVPEQIDIVKARELGLLDQVSTGDLLQNSGTVFLQKSQAGGGSPVNASDHIL